ncbi:MAG: glycosyltransferase [Desulfovibrio sp.]|jgi:spore maturation protein CgeB|nr:glycosyltransferase [Desulfovibrio sp.]
MLRVLVVLPFYGGSLPIGRFAVQGLVEAGCLVETFEAPEFYASFTALKNLKVGAARLDRLQDDYLRFVSQAVLSKAEAFAPDLVLCLAQAPMGRQALKRLRREGVLTAMWFVEDFRLFTYWRAFAPYYDVFAVIQKEPFTGELTKIGVEHSLYLPLAALPSVHKALALDEDERREFGSPLSFVGAGYPNRRSAFLALKDQGLKIWGTEWEDEPRLAPLVQRGGARISSEDCVRIFNASDININLHSSIRTENLVSHGDFVNPRTFEVAACGAFQLVDERGLMPELFAPDELATFGSMEELREKIAFYLARPDERRSVAARGRARVLAEHDYAARMRQLLAYCAETFPGFGKRAGVAWPDNMPEDARAAVESLMDELRLPPSAGFEDVIAAVRGKKGLLSDAEAALLFLDEWKKLYLG